MQSRLMSLLERRLTHKGRPITLKNLRVPEFFEMNSGSERPEQIPTEYNEEQTLRAVRKQDQTPGERREKTINDFSIAAAVARILKDIEFPADKQTIVTFVEKLNTPHSK